MNPDSWKAYLSFGGGLLAFSAAIINILNNQLGKIDNKKERAIWWFKIGCFATLFILVTGMFVNMFVHRDVGLAIFAVGVVCWAIIFIRTYGTPSRVEILFLIGLVGAFIYGLLQSAIMKIIDTLITLTKAIN